MGVVGAAIKGFGKALMKGKKGIRSAVKQVLLNLLNQGVGGLKITTERRKKDTKICSLKVLRNLVDLDHTTKFGTPCYF